MIPFTLTHGDKVDTHFLPQSWEEISYDQYADIMAVFADETIGSQEKAARLVSVLSKLPMATINEADFQLVNQLFSHLGFLSVLPEPQPVAHVTIDGVNYYPQLIEKMGELVAYDQIETEFSASPVDKWPYILAVLLRPLAETDADQPKITWFQALLGRKQKEKDAEKAVETFEYDQQRIQKRAKLFRLKLNPVQILGLAAFFLQNDEASRRLTQHYSAVQRIQATLNASLDSTSGANMAGNPRLMTLNRLFLKGIRFFVRMSPKS